MTANLSKEEPPPIPNDSKPMWLAVIEDMHERDRIGRERYGTPLQAFNGRNSLHDAFQEVLDLAVYLRTEIEERQILLATEEAGARSAEALSNAMQPLCEFIDVNNLVKPAIDGNYFNTALRLIKQCLSLDREMNEVEQVLGKALGYPELYEADDPERGPITCGPEYLNAKPTGTVCIGDHVPGSLAQEAANRIKHYEEEILRLSELLKQRQDGIV